MAFAVKQHSTRTFIRWSTLANSWVLTDNLQYSLSPGLATSRSANSLWNISKAHLFVNKRWQFQKQNTSFLNLQKFLKFFLPLHSPEERTMQQQLEDNWRWNLKTSQWPIIKEADPSLWTLQFGVQLKLYKFPSYWSAFLLASNLKGFPKLILQKNQDLTWYGKFATQTLKNGSSVFRTSPTITCSLEWSGLQQKRNNRKKKKKSMYPRTKQSEQIPTNTLVSSSPTFPELVFELRPPFEDPIRRLSPGWLIQKKIPVINAAFVVPHNEEKKRKASTQQEFFGQRIKSDGLICLKVMSDTISETRTTDLFRLFQQFHSHITSSRANFQHDICWSQCCLHKGKNKSASSAWRPSAP